MGRRGSRRLKLDDLPGMNWYKRPTISNQMSRALQKRRSIKKAFDPTTVSNQISQMRTLPQKRRSIKREYKPCPTHFLDEYDDAGFKRHDLYPCRNDEGYIVKRESDWERCTSKSGNPNRFDNYPCYHTQKGTVFYRN